MNTPLPPDYAERVYAGVLGKVIGVYLGRPFEGWPYEWIRKRLGDIEYYVHERLDVPLIVTDDDITGTFTFLRALEDHGAGADLSSREIGETWLNYLIRERTVLWWGGLGNSTEHTAYLRLKSGIEAPESGSMELNGKVVAEQIGAQIFIDGWAMVAPGDPDLAVRLATAAARVSHDGEAVYGARVLAAMESMAFVEGDTAKLLDAALGYIPPDSVIARMIGDLRRWHAADGDWHANRARLAERYGYDKYGGNCHMVPNHGLIILALLHGDSDFAETLKIVNTCGWDTDCNSGNVGCLLGIKEGLAGIERGLEKGLDWRGPVADRVYLPTADGGRAISDCGQEALQIVNMGRRLAGRETLAPKDGAQFHFAFPGSVQGFQVAEGEAEVRSFTLPSGASALRIEGKGEARVGSPVFIPSLETAKWFEGRVYPLMASPRIFPGQTVEATLNAGEDGVRANVYLGYYGENDETATFDDEILDLEPGASRRASFTVPDLAGPVFSVGVRVQGPAGTVFLESLKWSGAPTFRLERPAHRGTMWRRAWVNGVDLLTKGTEMFRLVQNAGMGLLMQGTREWRDYSVTADVTPHLVERAGVAARVQGLTRFYGLLLAPRNRVQLVRMLHAEEVLAEADVEWRLGESYELALEVRGDRLAGKVDGATLVEATDDALACGAVGLVIEEGRLGVDRVEVRPVD
ncbi:MAG: ADP-ribosylglycohydrolase family protein [Acidobacteriota bacterium]|nr:ADP-ribosylglycohydrolase family protein [Acidobacteriota bacterium]